MGLRKLLKKARKGLGLPPLTLRSVAKGAAVVAGGPLAVGTVLGSKAASAAAGGIKQVIRTKAAKSANRKLDQLGPVATTAGAATRMPGGAKLPAAKKLKRKAKRAKLPRVKRRAAMAAPAAPKRAAKGAAPSKARKGRRRAPAKPAGGSKRKPPTGGLDLKALSASWKAAGKPGTWQGWIAAHK